MEGPLAIGGLVALIAFAVWFLVTEAKSGATSKETAKAMREVIDATKRFNKARRDSAGLPRRERLAHMREELRASNGSSVSTGDGSGSR